MKTKKYENEAILKKMTLEDKIAICSGADFWHTKAFSQYGIPESMMTDGPHGLRKQTAASDMLGVNKSVPATCFPTAVTTGACWKLPMVIFSVEFIRCVSNISFKQL